MSNKDHAKEAAEKISKKVNWSCICQASSIHFESDYFEPIINSALKSHAEELQETGKQHKYNKDCLCFVCCHARRICQECRDELTAERARVGELEEAIERYDNAIRMAMYNLEGTPMFDQQEAKSEQEEGGSE